MKALRSLKMNKIDLFYSFVALNIVYALYSFAGGGFNLNNLVSLPSHWEAALI